jgi:hypothetical protein
MSERQPVSASLDSKGTGLLSGIKEIDKAGPKTLLHPFKNLNQALTRGCPGDVNARRCNFPVTRVFSASLVAWAKRLRNLRIFSLRVRRRRISGRRLGADICYDSFMICNL